MKYLLQAIDARRDCVRLSDHELRDLLIEVRNGKDDKIEFTESMVRLLEELKNSEHASAFLTKVAKRDAPDYYDVIKNPMDLGTMMRNVRQGRYKSKAQFMRDLDLIWDNCLTYNSEPTHPLRRSVQVLRSKANHLLTYVNDTNDVKEALNQWQASLGLRTRPADIVNAEHVSSFGSSEQATSMSAQRDRTTSMAVPRLSVAVLFDTPFEQRSALLRNADSMSTFARLDASQVALDREFAKRYLSAFDEVGPSSRQLMVSDDSMAEQAVLSAASVDMLKTLEGAQGGILRAALTTPPLHVRDSEHVEQRESHSTKANGAADNVAGEEKYIPYALETEDDEKEESANFPFDSASAWWNSMSHPSMLPAGVTSLDSSEQMKTKRLRRIGGRPGKRKKSEIRGNWHGTSQDDKDGAPARLVGGVEALERNVQTIIRLRRMHTKYARLHGHIESGEPIPAELGVVSSDEEEEHDEQESKKGLQHGGVKSVRTRRKGSDTLMLPIQDIAGNPYHKLGGEAASNMLQNKTNLLLAHAGFDASQKSAADVITDIAGEFLMNVGRTLRNYADRFSHDMSVEELILHTLFENGALDVRGLESYVADDVLRYGNKMSDLLRKLRASYRETLAHSDLAMADEEAYFGAQSHVDSIDAATANRPGAGALANGATGDGGEEDEHILRGGYAKELADEDFFGFKDMGLDEELGIDVGRQLAAMPSRMFSRRAQDEAGQRGMAAKSRAGPGSGESGSTTLEFEPPEPFVPLSEASITAQIGLLRAFYRDLLRTRGQWQRIGNEQQGENDERGDLPAAGVGAHLDGAPTEEEEAEVKDAYVILPDEEQERQRYKVPPTGKMPRRAMKQRLTSSSTTSQPPSNKPTTNGIGASANAAANRGKSSGVNTPTSANGRSSATGTKSKSGNKKTKNVGPPNSKAQHAAQAITIR